MPKLAWAMGMPRHTYKSSAHLGMLSIPLISVCKSVDARVLQAYSIAWVLSIWTFIYWTSRNVSWMSQQTRYFLLHNYVTSLGLSLRDASWLRLLTKRKSSSAVKLVIRQTLNWTPHISCKRHCRCESLPQRYLEINAVSNPDDMKKKEGKSALEVGCNGR